MPVKKTHDEFVSIANKVYPGGQYRYDTKYINSTTKITITCTKHNFTFAQTPKGHLRGHRCKQCSSEKRSASLSHGPEHYHAIIEDRDDIEWLGPLPASTKDHTQWRCVKDGHVWTTSYSVIAQGCGCPECFRVSPSQYTELAKERGFSWLGPEVPTTGTATTWACNEGHQWKTSYSNVKKGTGCPHCVIKSRRRQPSDYEAIASQRDDISEWLGPEVTSVSILTNWRCSNGHVFSCRLNDVQKGVGCSECAGLRKRTEKDYHDLASEFNLEFLGPVPESSQKKTSWRCQNGHTFKQHYSRIKSGITCSACSGTKKLEAHDYHKLASENDLRWVGKSITNANTLSEWECTRGHRFTTRYSDLKQKKVKCKLCSESLGEKSVRKILDAFGITHECQKKFSTCRNQRDLPFDFYLPCVNVLIEFDGRQHFERVVFGSSVEEADRAFELTQVNDKIKTAWAADNNIPLIRIPYTCQDIQAELTAQLERITGKPIAALAQPPD